MLTRWLAACLLMTPATLAEEAPKPVQPIRWLLPRALLGTPRDRVFQTLAAEFNLAHPRTPVTLLFRGHDLSSVREAMALQLAGQPPHLATLGLGEVDSVRRFLRPLPPLAPRGELGPLALPFQLTRSVLVANTQLLPKPEPQATKNWSGLRTLVEAATERSSGWGGGAGLLFPLLGARGPRMLEAWSELPLWKRERGGLRMNRVLLGPLGRLARWTHGKAMNARLTWDRALQEFLDQRAPLLWTTTDALPAIADRATFKSVTLDPPAESARWLQGSVIVELRDAPGVDELLAFIYSRSAVARWATQGGYLDPLNPQTLKHSHLPSRDEEAVRANAEWAVALQGFLEVPQTPDLESDLELVLAQIEGRLEGGR